MDKRIVIVAIILCLIPAIQFSNTSTSVTTPQQAFDKKVDLHGGVFRTKKLAIWELYQYKDTKLLRKSPLCYAPWESYVAVDKYVDISNIKNYNALIIKTDLIKIVGKDAKFNKAFARRFKGRSMTRIYNYCSRTKYLSHHKTAREVFEHRQGDCAGISSAFYVICKTNHIPVRYVIGWCGNTCHAWNRVRIKGKWYWVDCTIKQKYSRQLWYNYSIMEMW